MPKTAALCLSKISDWHNVTWAMHKALKGKRSQSRLSSAQSHPEVIIEQVTSALAQGQMPCGTFTQFVIHDPKRRIIHCTPFADRVAHHALVRFMEPTFERVLLPQVYACREGKGIHRAVHYAQQQACRYPWVMHVDIAQYFPNIRHDILWQQLRRRFRGDGMYLVQAVIDSYANIAARGLPIGSLTSQHFANHYLNEADRWLLAQANVRAMCRYMDDYLIWADSKQALVTLQYVLSSFLQAVLGLTAKPALIQASTHGVLFCGIRIKPLSLKPSLRRKRRYKQALWEWHARWLNGDISSLKLQQSYASIRTVLLPADDAHWRSACHHHLKLSEYV